MVIAAPIPHRVYLDPDTSRHTVLAFRLAATEVLRQDRKWGPQTHPDGTGHYTTPLAGYPANAAAAGLRVIAQQQTEDAFAPATDTTRSTGTWRHILLEEVFEALAEEDPEKLQQELIQVAAVALQWAGAIDRRLMEANDADRAGRGTDR